MHKEGLNIAPKKLGAWGTLKRGGGWGTVFPPEWLEP